jgi:hypothetical protein
VCAPGIGAGAGWQPRTSVLSATRTGGCLRPVTVEIVIRRQDDVPPDDAALLRVAEQVLPTIPGWPAG